MVEFEYQPWNKFIIHEIVKLPLQNFVSEHSLGVEAGGIGRPLLWANGIIFEHIMFPDTKDMIKEKLQGKVHWSSLRYTIQEIFQPEFRAGSIRIPVINVSDNQVFREMVNWIKKTFEKKE